MPIQDWSTTADSNTTLEGISWAEGMMPAGVNNGVRAIAAAIKAGTANRGADISSAATINLGAATGQYVVITGTTGITSLGTAPEGTTRDVEFSGALTLTHNATTLILPGGTSITTAAGDVARFVAKGTGWKCLFFQRAATYALGSLQVFTASGTWTRPAGCRAIDVEVLAGGGGGGGCTGLVSNAAAGAGGSAGSYGRKWITSPNASETVTIGAGGTAGVAAAGNGGDGGASSFGAIVLTTGGGGGSGFAATTGFPTRSSIPAVTAAGSGGDVNVPGEAGDAGLILSIGAPLPGKGGLTRYGAGGAPVAINLAGNNGSGYGSGGGGAATANVAANRAGGAGAGGIVIVHEYY